MSADPEFENLVTLYYRDLFRFACSLARNDSEAADFTQQTFYLWARKGRQLREPSRVKSWLFTTLHREFLQVRRRRTRFPEQDLEEAAGELPEISPDAMAQMDGRTVLEYLGQIAEHHRGPLVLYFLEDYSYQEIAEVLGVPLGTVQSRIARGKTQLYRMLTSGSAAARLGQEDAHE